MTGVQWGPMMAQMGIGMVMAKEMMLSIMQNSQITLQPAQLPLSIVSSPCPIRKMSLPIIPSSDDSPDLGFAIDYPLLSGWLLGLDTHASWGRDEQHYVQWSTPLRLEGFICLNDLYTLTSTELREICIRINHGTASRILTYAKGDVEKLEREGRHAMKRARND